MNDAPAYPPEAYEPCGSCGHCPAYCKPDADKQPGETCIAWVPEHADGKCGCAKRTTRAAPVPVVSHAIEYDEDVLHEEWQ